ncbi:tastin [Dendropsophus ebraccatus]|uniref:tastin n=1 Tax=Dendropsophus ebraccatus TaxID=150705 RepID=UPI0038320CED
MTEMQSCNEAISEFGCKSSIVPKTTWMKGKENGMNAPTGIQASKQKTPLEMSQDPPRSRLPIPSKTKEPLDFQKLHQSWQNQFQKGKAVKKRPCTRTQPFNFSQPRDRSRVTTDKGEPVNPQANHRRREPLAEVTQKNQGSKDAEEKGGSEEFKADPAALASILSHIGVSNAAAGKLSLAQRVPMRGSSITQSSNICKNTMVRSSMYAVLRSQSASSNLDRVSCFSKMQAKVNDQKPVFKQNPLVKRHVPDSSLKELAASNLGDELQSQENPVLQQMNQTGQAQASSVTSPPLRSQEVTTVMSDQVTEGRENSAATADGCEKNTLEVDLSTRKIDPMKMGEQHHFSLSLQ